MFTKKPSTGASGAPHTPGRPTPGSGLRSLFAPMALAFDQSAMTIGDHWARTYLLTALPPSVSAAWLSDAANLPGVTLSLHALPEDASNLVLDLSRKIAQLAGQLETKSSALTEQRTAQQLHDAQALMKQLDAEHEAAFTIAIILTVSAVDTVTGLRRARTLENKLAAHSMRVRTLTFRQESGLKAAGPWGWLPADLVGTAPYVLPVSTVAASWPFSAGGINHGHGIALGTDAGGGLVLLDRWEPPAHAGIINPNFTILAVSGGGKTYATITMLLREYATGTQIFIMDPEKREYQRVCHQVDGHWLNAGGGTTRINPFQAPAAAVGADGGLSPLILHIQRVLTFLTTFMSQLTPIAQALLAGAVRETYEAHGLAMDCDPATIPNVDWPDISHLYAVCQRHAAQEPDQSEWKTLVALLQEAAVGVLSGLWAGPSTVPQSAQADFVVADLMDLHDAPDHVKRAQYLNVLGYLWDLVRRDKSQRKILIADEAWMLVDAQNPDTLRFLKQVAKLIRGYNGSLMTITQNVFDFLAPAVRQDGEPVLSNAGTTLLLRQDKRNLQSLTELFDLSEQEQDLLSGAVEGQGLLIAGNQRTWITVKASAYEDAIITGR